MIQLYRITWTLPHTFPFFFSVYIYYSPLVESSSPSNHPHPFCLVKSFLPLECSSNVTTSMKFHQPPQPVWFACSPLHFHGILGTQLIVNKKFCNDVPECPLAPKLQEGKDYTRHLYSPEPHRMLEAQLIFSRYWLKKWMNKVVTQVSDAQCLLGLNATIKYSQNILFNSCMLFYPRNVAHAIYLRSSC